MSAGPEPPLSCDLRLNHALEGSVVVQERASACSPGPATNRASATAGAGRRYRLYGLSDHGEELF